VTAPTTALVTSLRALLDLRGIERLYVQRDDNDAPVGMLMDGLGNVAFHYEEEDQALAERIVALIAAAPELLDAHEALRAWGEAKRAADRVVTFRGNMGPEEREARAKWQAAYQAAAALADRIAAEAEVR
jgi:hypothetical protein